MKQWLILVAVVILTTTSASAVYAQPESQLSDEEIRALRQILKKDPKAAAPGTGALPAGAPQKSDAGAKGLEELSKPRDIGEKYGSTMEGSGTLIYARPFVSKPKAIVGGYYDFEYINKANDGEPSNFDQHRLVPFIYADVSEHVKFATEIEIEHGGQDSTGSTEVKVEFAVADYLIAEPVNLRGGILLLPLGKFNLLHDAPLRDLTERPIVNQRIIPTTLHQPGVGLYGTFYPTRVSKMDYELYVTTGFTNAFGGEDNPVDTPPGTGVSNITNTDGIRKARSNSTSFDNNNGKAVVGRIAFSPILGVELGGSTFYGSYDPQSTRPLWIAALDWTFQRGPFEVIGESAWSYIRDNNLNTSGVPISNNQTNSRRMQGYYIQLNYHFLPQWMTNLAPTHFRPEVSTFTAVVRWEENNLGQDLPDTETGRLGERQRLTLGLNFRPTEDTVFKTDFQYSPKDVRGSQRIHDHGFLASIATYF